LRFDTASVYRGRNWKVVIPLETTEIRQDSLPFLHALFHTSLMAIEEVANRLWIILLQVTADFIERHV
jgi:hypothetical protein